jgi:hypothetical protein
MLFNPSNSDNIPDTFLVPNLRSFKARGFFGMTILCDLINSKNKPKQALTQLASAFYEKLSQQEIITLTGILLRLFYQTSDKKPDNVFQDHPLIEALLNHILIGFNFFALQQNKNDLTQSLLQAYHLEKTLEDKKQEILRNQILVAQFELDLKYQEIEMACLDTANAAKKTVQCFKTKFKIAKKALKHSQLAALEVQSQLHTLKQKIKDSLRHLSTHLMILFAPLFDEHCKSHANASSQMIAACFVQLTVLHAKVNKACPKAALPLLEAYLKKLMAFPDKIGIPFVASLHEALNIKELVYLNHETLSRIQNIFETNHEVVEPASVVNAISVVPSSKKNIHALIKDFLWSNFLAKRSALYN